MISIQHLERKDFEAGAAKEVFPELYECKKLIENTQSGSHKGMSVFEHSINTFEHLKGALKSMRLSAARSKKVTNVLAEQVGNYDSWQLLLFAALLHDIGKRKCMRTERGITSAPGHEALSAQEVVKMKFRLGLVNKDVKYLERIIKHHGDAWQLISAIVDDERSWRTYWDPFRKTFRRHTYGLLLLTYADLLASSWSKTDKPRFVKRSIWIKKLMAQSGY